MANNKARVIAIYLPQYHPIPENDEVWGKGFTEWTNVAQAKPLFKGHYQPRIPRDLGFYDLRMPEIREAQAELARNAGIEGFMYWQYYFGNGKKLLERPFEEVLASGKPDFPFCLGWANHSWQTLTWKRDADNKEGKTMIMEQRYDGEQQYIDHFMYNLPAFKDNRYMTVYNKPIFVIWNPKEQKNEISKMIKCWNKLAIENGFKGIHFVAQKTIGITSEELFSMGFNAIYLSRTQQALNKSEQWTLWNKIKSKCNLKSSLLKVDFAKYYKLLNTSEAENNNVYPCLLSGYDRSPRAGKKAQIFYNFTPESWREHIKDVLHYVKNKDCQNNLIILKSWNEWGESNYMEPDLKYGSALLDILHDELIKFSND